ncbi:MAG: Lrp/AsnC family transcriptional regulator [Nanoarchaeota archaeon]|nr:Lrp/AsnC family transcriptional regulator [Nanoarchaeota archaeon]MBU1632179.1 Lrp/AsnC family transcriptional regulator [Nanoarchaeota archaeon]MBU1875500.1 Lrp/AsnC family transcriptional regulator [Nanoarchaeota archaeon]
MNEKELQIISHLRNDARTSLSTVSQEVEMPISTVYDKVTRMHKSSIVKKYTALVDFPKLGYHYNAKIALRVPREQKGELFTFLQNHKSINSFHEINNGFDFLIETIHKDIKEYLSFMEILQESFTIQELHEYQIINDVFREKFL